MSTSENRKYMVAGSVALLADWRGPVVLRGAPAVVVSPPLLGSASGACFVYSASGARGVRAEDLHLDLRRFEARALVARALGDLYGLGPVSSASVVIRGGLFGPVAELAGLTADGRDFIPRAVPTPPGEALDDCAELPDGTRMVAARVLAYAWAQAAGGDVG